MHPKALLDEAARLIELVLKFDHPADATAARYFRENRSLGPRERATLSDTVFRVLRHRLLLQWQAEGGEIGGGIGGEEGGKATLPRRLAILTFAADDEFVRGAMSEAEWAWRATALAKNETSHGWKPEFAHHLPPWLAEALQAQVGADAFPALAEALDQPATLDLRVNVMKKKRDAVLAELRQAGLACEPTPYSPVGIRLQEKTNLTKLPAYTSGDIEIQDEGSQLLSLLLDARRQHVAVDFCAGAGGKTLAIGAAMRNGGRLYAFDTSAHRLEAIKPRLQRSGLSNVHTVVIAHERDERILRLAGKVDRVLVDAPCTGLGTLRRNPDLKWRQSPKTVAEHAELQQRILASTARLLKPGGRLVYATCSLLPQENEAVAQAFDAAHPRDFQPVPVAKALASGQVPQPETLCAGGEDGERFLRLWPHRHGTDGFFAAVWERKA